MPKFEIPASQPSLIDILKTVPAIIRIAKEAHPVAFWVTFVNSVLNAPLNAFYVYGMGYLTSALVERDVELLQVLIMGFIGHTAINSIRFVLNQRFTEEHQLMMKTTLEVHLKNKLMHLSAETMEDANFQALKDAYERKFHVGFNAITNFRNIVEHFFALLGIITSFVIIPLPATVVLAFALVVEWALASRAARAHWAQLMNDTRDGRRARYYDKNLEDIGRLSQLRSLVADSSFYQLWQKYIGAINARQKQNMKNSLLAESSYEVIEGIAFIIGLVIVTSAVVSGSAAINVAMTFVTGFQNFASRFHNLNAQINWLKQQGQFFTLHREFHAVEVEDPRGLEAPVAVPELQCVNVSFRYDGSDSDTLKKVNLTVRAGERIAIVGENGSGKTTLVKLLTRTYRPTSGSILSDGTDIWAHSPTAWRKTIACLTQKRYELSDTIRNQVMVTEHTEGDAEERFRAVMDISQLVHVVNKHPKGAETFAGRDGAMPEDHAIEFSGGERQMLSIAQILFRQAQVYIFDEPTSAIDVKKSGAFFDRLRTALFGKTVIFISHHFATVKRASRILVMDGGCIIEDGTHEELLRLGGKYSELYRKECEQYLDGLSEDMVTDLVSSSTFRSHA